MKDLAALSIIGNIRAKSHANRGMNFYLEKLKSGIDLEVIESFDLFSKLHLERESFIKEILTLLYQKKESESEIFGALKYFAKEGARNNFADIVGTGGDALNTFNISTASALLCSTLGAKIAKHGGKAVSSKTGSMDVIEALGLKYALNLEEALNDLELKNFTFLWAPIFNEKLKFYRNIRKELKFPSIFNILGPLLNPLKPKNILIGVYRFDLLEKIANILLKDGINHALVVHSKDGLDEISISDETYIYEIKNDQIKNYNLNPKNFGFKLYDLDDIKGGDAKENAKIIKNIFLKRSNAAKRDILILNSAALLYVSNIAKNLKEGILLSKMALEKGIDFI